MRKYSLFSLTLIILATLFFGEVDGQNITLSPLPTGVAPSPLGNNATDVAILGIQFDKAGGGTNSISALTIALTQNPVGRFTNPRLVRSDNNAGFDAADLANVVGSAAFGATSINITGGITTFSGNSGAETRRFFVVVDIDNSVTSATPAVTPSTANTNVTATGTVNAATVTGIAYSFADATPPAVTFNPTNGSTGFPLASSITITFDEPIRNIDDSPITAGDLAALVELKLTNNGGAIVPSASSINASNTVITITPSSSLTSNTVYYVEINPVEDGSNNAIAATNITFTSQDIDPPIITFNPANVATGIVETTTITITFNESVRKLDNSAITNGDLSTLVELKLTNNAGGTVPFTATINPAKKIITITPSSVLGGNTLYYVEMNPVEDASDNAIIATNITFTTGDTLPPSITFNPANGATNVSAIGNIIITFSEPIRKLDDSPITALDIQGGLVELKLTNNAGATVPFTAAISGGSTIITLSPSATLLPNQVYYVEVNPIEDAVNNASMATNITFTSEAAPTISSYSSDPTCMGETINITGSGFGSLVPTVTINGINVIPSANSPTSITVTVPATIAGNATVIVTNTSNNFNDSDNTLTLKAAIAATLPITTNPSPPATTFPFNVEVGSTQSSVNYSLAEIPPGTFGGTTAGTGATISFGPFTKATAGTYNYQVKATSAGCTNKIYPLSVTIFNLLADAGSDKIICKGDTTSIGGNPTAAGGSGFHMITWSASPADPSLVGQSNFSNPRVSPKVTTTYTVTVDDSSPATPVNDMIVVTVNQPTAQSELAIQLNPTKPNNTYQKTDDQVELSYTLGGTSAPFSGNTRFEGPGVNSTGTQKFFYPIAGNVGTNELVLFYENSAGCITKDTAIVFVRDNNLFLNGLDVQYCEGASDNLAIQSPIEYPPFKFDLGFFGTFYFPGVRYTYVTGNVQLRNADTDLLIITPGAFTLSGADLKAVALNTSLTGSGRRDFEIQYLIESLSYNDVTPSSPTVVGSSLEYIKVGFDVIAKPKIVDNIRPEACENDSPFTLNVNPIGGSFMLNGVPSSAILDPKTVGLPDLNTIIYNYTDPTTSCTNSITHNLILNRIAPIDIDFDNGCQDELIIFTPDFSGSILNFQYFWDLNGDGIIDAKAPTNAPQSVQQKYVAPSNYNVTLSLETDKGCKNSKTKVLTIGEVPDISLQWLNACDGDQTQVRINSNFFDSKLGQVDSIVWLFGDGASFKNGSPISSSNITSHTYSQIGNFAASAKIVTNLGCVNSTTAPVFKVKRDTVNKLNPYLEKFDSTFQYQGWVSGGTGSSWQWGTPTGTLISNDATIGGKAWVTNLSGSYNINEDSWVHSPCFDLTEIQRPFFKFDFRTLTRDGVDGTVLQYNYQNTTDVESDWIRIDAGSSSENWYNGSGILSNPGNQSVLQRGWTGLIDSASWRTAIIPLDAVLSNIPANSRNKVRFRLAFSSSQFPTNPEGFAFDNVEIGERDRIVLLESFTNSGGSNTGSEPNKVANQAINTFLNSGTGEVIKLEYHVGFPGPGEDPLYLNNQADIGARAAYYGVAKAPTSFVNARLGNLLSTFQKETLKAARVRFDTIQMLNNPSDKLNVRVKFTAKQLIPANSTLHIAIVENLIDNPKAIGTNGETSFTHVVRKLLPDAVGTNFSMPILKDSSKTVNVSWTPIAYDFTRLEIVAFLQNTTTGEVYQTALLTNPSNVPNPSVVTGIEQLAEYIQLYPNPASDSFVIELPTKTETRLRVNLIDQVGRPVQEAVFEVGEQTKTIDTQNLAGGIYIVQIGAGKLGVVRKKMMIVHKN